MQNTVNGASLYFDIGGSSLILGRPAMRGKPTMVPLHSGLDADRPVYKPEFDALNDVVQTSCQTLVLVGATDPVIPAIFFATNHALSANRHRTLSLL
jgi:hypothetical protein